MNNRIHWLPVGHVAHGYRRVFVIYQGNHLRHVVNIVNMPYEQVYLVREMAKGNTDDDPSLLWGLSIITSLMADGTLLNEANPDVADDGYIQLRAHPPTESELIPLPIYQSILRDGILPELRDIYGER